MPCFFFSPDFSCDLSLFFTLCTPTPYDLLQVSLTTICTFYPQRLTLLLLAFILYSQKVKNKKPMEAEK
ncbi:hypothetical protein K450DRAFT_247478 [Umbelopsis ramanniana AG]|uniref:Uncharacterized protein n=1 Tax=Umbelopsis ramanniana AG TaxID=1314678 RepID=A0AAD5E6L1_UMBRA|nr:uncharacterized protein K450DRAFT_247478 [Umbelopsis ramanniana AG]KAI8578346.1 hypothetical protein K450DRAFT_247478 [Umbelopsis ramanniana AG]